MKKASESKVGLVGLVLVAAACLVIGACNTMEGMGRDISAAGRGLENAADNAK